MEKKIIRNLIIGSVISASIGTGALFLKNAIIEKIESTKGLRRIITYNDGTILEQHSKEYKMEIIEDFDKVVKIEDIIDESRKISAEFINGRKIGEIEITDYKRK